MKAPRKTTRPRQFSTRSPSTEALFKRVVTQMLMLTALAANTEKLIGVLYWRVRQQNQSAPQRKR